MHALSSLFEAFSRLRENWPGGGWSWDRRLSCVASTFSVDNADQARRAASLALPVEWSEGTLRKAPALVHDIADSSGGLRSDQLLLTTASMAGVVGYGLWWPWGNGINLSMRVGIAGSTTERDHSRMRELFRVAD